MIRRIFFGTKFFKNNVQHQHGHLDSKYMKKGTSKLVSKIDVILSIKPKNLLSVILEHFNL